MSQIRRFLDLQIPSIQNHLAKQLGEALFLIAFFVFTFNSWLGLTGNKTLLFLDLNHFKKSATASFSFAFVQKLYYRNIK